MTDDQKAILRKHYDVFRLIHDDNYLPGEYMNCVNEVHKVWKEVHGSSVNLRCGTCITDMFSKLYIPFEKVSGGSALFENQNE